MPFVVVDRLGPSLYATASPASQAFARARLAEPEAGSLPYRKPPAWTFLHGLKSPLSSTALRAQRQREGTSSGRGRKKMSKGGKRRAK
jgi:nicotinate-nucleotide adenylyltransferase